MKKIVIAAISALVLMAGFSNAFAKISASPMPGMTLDSVRSLGGKIHFVDTMVSNNVSTIAMSIVDTNNNTAITVFFDGADLPVGAAFYNAVGKQITVGFDANGNVENLVIVQNKL